MLKTRSVCDGRDIEIEGTEKLASILVSLLRRRKIMTTLSLRWDVGVKQVVAH